jgi:hypothetical protein
MTYSFFYYFKFMYLFIWFLVFLKKYKKILNSKRKISNYFKSP